MENPYGSTPDYWRLCSDYLVVDDFAKGGGFDTRAERDSYSAPFCW